MDKIKNKSSIAARCRKLFFAGILAVIFGWSCLPARPFRAVEPIPENIMDMHCHIAGIGAGNSGCWVSPRISGSKFICIALAFRKKNF